MPARRPKPPPPTVLILVRHAETPTTGKVLPGRAAGLHLSDRGKAQAEATAERIAALARVDAVYASPLERARETAAPIAAKRGLKVTPDKGLLELDFGAWTGGELKALARTPEWRIVQQHPSGFTFPQGESFAAMQTRMAATLARLRDAHRGGVVVGVSHADTIKAAVAHAVGTPLDLFQRIIISPASVTVLVYGDLGPAVLAVNSVGDLTTLVPK